MLLRYLILAMRNVIRSRARALLTMSAIGFGVLMTLTLGAFVNGLGNVMMDDVILGKVGALQIHKKGYDDVRENQPLNLSMELGGDLERKIAAVRGVASVSPRLVFGGLLTNGTQSANYVGVGIDPVQEPKTLPWSARSLTGKPVSASADKVYTAVLGNELATALALQPGTTATLQAATAAEQQNALDLEVSGNVDNGNPWESKRVLMVPLAFAQELLDMPGKVTEYVVSVPDRDEIPAVAERLRVALGPDYEVQTWSQLRPNVADVVLFQRAILGAVGIVFLVIAVIGVINTMLMSVLERTREIGTMMAVGVKRRVITMLFLLEGLLLAVVGSFAGSVVAFVLVQVVVARGGIEATAPGATAIFAIFPDLPAWLLLPTIGLTLLGTLLAAAWPAYRASRLDPVEALRSV
jgi:putative ABC transport system permease protein